MKPSLDYSFYISFAKGFVVSMLIFLRRLQNSGGHVFWPLPCFIIMLTALGFFFKLALAARLAYEFMRVAFALLAGRAARSVLALFSSPCLGP